MTKPTPGVTYTAREMLELVRMHFEEAFGDPDHTKWSWALPMYLIEGTDWTEDKLLQIVDFHHNGPTYAR